MGIQEIIAVLVLTGALIFIGRRIFFSFKHGTGGDGCQGCGSDELKKNTRIKT